MINIEYSNFNIESESYNNAKSVTSASAEQIRTSIDKSESSYKIFSKKHALKQIEFTKHYAKEINQNFTDVIIIAIGGASLNPETLISLVGNRCNNTRIHFLNNTDPIFVQNLLSRIKLKTTAIVAISNSGKTLETISLVGVMIEQFHRANIRNFGKHFYFITNLQSGTLKDVANEIEATLIEHTPNISGRYSGLTNVSTFAAQIAGINVEEYLSGAESMLEDFYNNEQNSLALISATAIYHIKKPITVNIAYLQKFNAFLEWYSQIISESLGKDGKGITPIRGIGPNDQHSMFQLYLDGPKDKIYNIFYVDNINSDLKTTTIEELKYVSNKYLSDINEANFKATVKAIQTTKSPCRKILLQDLSPKTVGALVMFSMLEVIILGHTMRVNPFDQPGVELIKKESSLITQSL